MDESYLSNANAMALFGLFAGETRFGKRPCSLSLNDMAEKTKLSKMNVRTALNKLMACGVVDTETDNTVNGTVQTYVMFYSIARCKAAKTPTNTVVNTVLTQFEDLWKQYKKGVKKAAKEKWLRLSDEDRKQCAACAVVYRKLNVTQYTKGLEVYINQRYWETPITKYGIEFTPADINRFPSNERILKFVDWYNKEVEGTRLTPLKASTEERLVFINIALARFGRETTAVIRKAVADPYIAGAVPLQPNRPIPTFEELICPKNLLTVNE